jgi:hypothetical protein
VTPPDQMAAQLAQLLTGSDRAELEEIVRRWKLTAVSPGQRKVMDEMAEKILELRAALDQTVSKPSREELELALRMMLRLASEHR